MGWMIFLVVILNLFEFVSNRFYPELCLHYTCLVNCSHGVSKIYGTLPPSHRLIFCPLTGFARTWSSGHFQKVTWNPKMEVWKMSFLFNGVIFRLHVIFQGCTSMPEDVPLGLKVNNCGVKPTKYDRTCRQQDR